MLRLSVVDTNHYMTSLCGGELGTRTLTLIARASKTRMATNYINSPINIYIGPSSHFRDDDLPLFRRMLLPCELQRDNWCPERESNPHAEASELKSDVYASFTTGTYVWLRWLDSDQRMTDPKSVALSLGYISIWSGIEDLNLCPSAPKADAIPSYANSGGFDVTCRLHQPE